MFHNQDKRFNTRSYSINNNTPKSTVIDIRKRLHNKKLIVNDPGNAKITKLGIDYINNYDLGGSVPSVERVGQRGDLSTHYLKYKATITDDKNFNKDMIKKLDPIRIRQLDNPNLKQYFVYFDDCTIIINPKKVIIRIHDIISDDTEESHYISFNRAISYFDKLNDIGISFGEISLEPSHYERIDSILADLLINVDERYFLELPNGRKFWIDKSHNTNNDETNDEEYRERLDTVLSSIQTSESDFNDLDTLITVTKKLVKITNNLTILQSNSMLPYEIKELDNKKRDYFG